MLCRSPEATSGPRGRVRRFRPRSAASLPQPLDFRSAALPASLRQAACTACLYKCRARMRMSAWRRNPYVGINALRATPMPRPRRSALEGGRSPRTLRTPPLPGFPPSLWKSLARSLRTAPSIADTDPCPVARGAGHLAAGNREPDGPRRTLPPQLRIAVSSALRTASVQPPLPPLLPALHGNAVTPAGSRLEPSETDGFLPSPTQTGDDSATNARGLPPP